MAEWLGKGLQNPVPRFDSGCRLSEWRSTCGRLAQGESASLTRKRSVVRIHYRPLAKALFCSRNVEGERRVQTRFGAFVRQPCSNAARARAQPECGKEAELPSGSA